MGSSWRGTFAALDGLESAIQESATLPLTRIPVHDPPLWISGERPRVDRASVATVSLGPGQSVVIRAPAASPLRLDLQPGSRGQADLEVAHSDGGGLFQELETFPGEGGRFLDVPSPSSDPGLFRIAAPPGPRRPIEVALFLGRIHELEDAELYPLEVELPGSPVRLMPESATTARDFWHILPGQPLGLPGGGPTRWRVEVRGLYPPTEAEDRGLARLLLTGDDGFHHTLPFLLAPEMEQRVLVEGHPRPLTRTALGFVEIPATARTMEIDTTWPLLVRIQRLDERPFLHPTSNAPPDMLEFLAGRPASLFAGQEPWEMNPDEVVKVLQAEPRLDLEGVERLALRLARDNGFAGSPMMAWDLLDEVARLRPDQPRLRVLRDLVRGSATGQRELLPFSIPVPDRLEPATFVDRRLVDVEEDRIDSLVAEQHAPSLGKYLGHGHFLAVPAREEGAISCLEYRLPHRAARSVLSVSMTGPVTDVTTLFHLQLDDEPPRTLRWIPELCRPEGEWRVAPGEGAIAVASLKESSGAGTLPERAGGWRLPAELTRVSRAEVPLPPGVSRVRVWRGPGPDGGARLSLHYRISRPARLPETEYREMVRRLPENRTTLEIFVEALAGPTTPTTPSSLGEYELRNHFLPAIRFLRQEMLAFGAGVRPIRSLEPFCRGTRSPGESLGMARSLEASRDWAALLQLAGDISLPGEGPVACEWLQLRVAALRGLGEDYLVDRFLRALALGLKSGSLRDTARSLLAAELEKRDEGRALLGLEVLELAASGDPQDRLPLVSRLARLGESDLALQVLLLDIVDPDQVPEALGLALERGWRATFDELLAGPRDGPTVERWLARAAWAGGSAAKALEHSARAGAPAMSDHAGQARALGAWLPRVSREPAERIQALFAADASRSTTTTSPWSPVEGPVTATGSRTLLNRTRDLAASWWRAAPEEPVTVEVPGPAWIRVVGRPLLPREASHPKSDWLEVRWDHQARRVPMLDDWPNENLQVVGAPDEAVGREQEAILELGPGQHAVEVRGLGGPVLVRLENRRAGEPWGFRPTRSVAEIARTVAGTHPSMRVGISRGTHRVGLEEAASDPDRGVRVLREGKTHEELRVRVRPPTLPGDWLLSTLLEGVTDPVDRLRLTLRTTTDPLPGASVSAVTTVTSIPREEIDEFNLRALGDDPPASTLERLPLRVRWRHQVAAERSNALLEADLEAGAGSVREYLDVLLRILETRPDRSDEIQGVVERLEHRGPGEPGLQPVLSRLTRGRGWVLVTDITKSAGVREIDPGPDRYESASIMARRSFLGSWKENEMLVHADADLVLATRSRQPARFRVDLALADLPFLAPEAARARIQVDAETSREVSIGVEPHDQTLEVPAGEHSLRVGLETPRANQYLRVAVTEILPGGDSVPLRDERRRRYHRATRDEPVSFRSPASGLIRIDRWIDGRIHQEVRDVEAGERVVVEPRPGEAEGLVRIFRRAPTEDRVLPVPRDVAERVEPVPLLASPVGLAGPLPAYRFRERAPSGHEGALEVGLDVARRRLGQEDRELPAAEEFRQLRMVHRRRSSSGEEYQKSWLLARDRNLGGPVLGAGVAWRAQSRGEPEVLGLEASLHLQEPGGHSGSLEASARVEATVRLERDLTPRLDHLSQLSVFGRILSLADVRDLEPGTVDQDLFTPYKRDHLSGLILGQGLRFRPTLDSRVKGNLSLTSNELQHILDPDNLRLELGFEQKIGHLEMGLEAQVTRFFPDAQRLQGNTRRFLHLDFLALRDGELSRWMEWGLRLTRDLDRLETTGQLSVRVNLDRDREMRDLAPGEVGFRELRRMHRERDVLPARPD